VWLNWWCAAGLGAIMLTTIPVPPFEFAFGIIETIGVIANMRMDAREIFFIFDKFLAPYPFSFSISFVFLCVSFI
jgi:hypothetical protein